VGPQGGYVVGGISAMLAATALAPLMRLRREAHETDADTPEVERYTSAEELDSVVVPTAERRPA
jgi:hypothetical protein